MDSAATYCGTVYPWQCDHVGHMNIMWYAGKFDEANWNLFARIGLTPTYLRQSNRAMAAVQQNISYKRELFAGDIVEVKSRLQINNAFAIRSAALAGAGIIMQRKDLLADDIAQGRLKVLLPDYKLPPRPRHVVWLQNRRMTPKLRVFLDYIIKLYG